MTLQQAAQQALDIQDACNLSGVAFAFGRAMQAVCDAGRDKGTDWRNSHPIVTMHLLKMCELNGCGSTLHESYDKAEVECKAIAACSGDGGCIYCNTPANASGKF
jgi:hypothetical protein